MLRRSQVTGTTKWKHVIHDGRENNRPKTTGTVWRIPSALREPVSLDANWSSNLRRRGFYVFLMVKNAEMCRQHCSHTEFGSAHLGTRRQMMILRAITSGEKLAGESNAWAKTTGLVSYSAFEFGEGEEESSWDKDLCKRWRLTPAQHSAGRPRPNGTHPPIHTARNLTRLQFRRDFHAELWLIVVAR